MRLWSATRTFLLTIWVSCDQNPRQVGRQAGTHKRTGGLQGILPTCHWTRFRSLRAAAAGLPSSADSSAARPRASSACARRAARKVATAARQARRAAPDALCYSTAYWLQECRQISDQVCLAPFPKCPGCTMLDFSWRHIVAPGPTLFASPPQDLCFLDASKCRRQTLWTEYVLILEPCSNQVRLRAWT